MDRGRQRSDAGRFNSLGSGFNHGARFFCFIILILKAATESRGLSKVGGGKISKGVLRLHGCS